MTNTSTDHTERMEREDTLHAGATRPAKLWGLPYPLALPLMVVGYLIQTNLTGWYGLSWALTIVGPCWLVAALIVRHDTYGASVFLAWARTSIPLLDKGRWGGASCSPLPARKHPIGRKFP